MTTMQRSNACLLCGSSDARVLYQTGEGVYFRCRRCGLVAVDPIPDPGGMKQRAEYWANQHHKLEQKVAAHYSPQFQKIAFGPYLRRFENYRKSGRILDVGCGIGGFVDAAQKAGWDAYGIDVSSSVEVAQRRGLQVMRTTLDWAGFPESHFDVVTLFDVIEHIPDPQEMIRGAARVLRPDGCLFLLTPNQGSLLAKVLGARWEAVEPLDHIALYNRHTLTRLLAEFGCRPLRVQTLDLNIMEFKKLVVAMSAARDRVSGQKKRRALIDLFLKVPVLRGARGLANHLLTWTGWGDKLVVESIYEPRD